MKPRDSDGLTFLDDLDSDDDLAGDKQVLRVMVEHGADLSKVTHFNHYMYFDAEPDADIAASSIRREFDDVEIEEDGDRWRLCVSHHMVPSLDNVIAVRSRLAAQAVAAGGMYDGWEAAVTT